MADNPRDVEFKQMEGLLETICMGLEENDIPMPPELLDWWISFKKPKIVV